MNSIILKSLKGITAASVEKYLIFTGWKRDKTFANPKLWVFSNKEDPEFRLAIPGNENSKDFYYKLFDIVETLSAYTNRDLDEIISGMKCAYTDRIQFRIISSITQEGKLPLKIAIIKIIHIIVRDFR